MENRFSFKKIFGNSMWQVSEKIITMLLSIIVTSIIARYLGTEKYGMANYIISIVMLFTAFSTLGMESITINDIVSKKYKTDNIIGTSFVIRLIGGIVLIIISQITIYILTGGDYLSQILGIIMGTCMMFKAFEVIEYYLQAEMKLKNVAIIRFITAIIVAISKLIVVYFDFGIIGFVSTYLLDAVVAGFLFYIYYKIKKVGIFKFDKTYAKDLLKKCWYIAVAGLLATIYMRIDQVMLGNMLESKSENGIYSAAIRIAEMWYFIPLAIIASFQPVIISYKTDNDFENYNKNMQKLYDIIAIVGFTFGILISMFGWIAIKILYGDEYIKSADILLISAWSGLFATLGSARSVWLVAENKQKYTLVYTAIGCVLNIILNMLLIPQIGSVGAAIATLVVQIVSNVFVLLMFKETRKSSVMILKAIFVNRTVLDVLKFFKNHKNKKLTCKE